MVDKRKVVEGKEMMIWYEKEREKKDGRERSNIGWRMWNERQTRWVTDGEPRRQWVHIIVNLSSSAHDDVLKI